ncbi:MAG: saccharopine dehydrogenase NADP-binding domain-containing protein [Bacteroidales bacterium]|nr:saccharopine dehydrogenase NADP-binding domain-containing protein [Bacteroidales bacterium]
MRKNKRITLLGATGYTGNLIAQKLISRELKFTLAGRNSSKLSDLRDKLRIDLPVKVVDVENPSQIIRMLENTEILINCVGPYNLLGQIILAKVTEKPVVYFDISGEQEFVKNSFEKNHQQAIKTGASIVHSFAFESCLADFLAQRIIKKGQEYKDISSFYFFNKTRPSSGTRLTMEISHLYPAYIYENSKMVNVRTFSRSKDVEFSELPGLTKALFLPYPEVLFFTKNYKVKNAGSYLLMEKNEAKFALAGLNIPKKPLKEILKRSNKRNTVLPEKEKRALQRFILCVKTILMDNTQKSITLKGADMYGITASLVSKAIEYVVKMSDVQTGVLTPAKFINNQAFFNEIISECQLVLKENTDLIEFKVG